MLADKSIPAGIAMTEEHQDDEYKDRPLHESTNTAGFRHIDWVKLKESGIDAVRVNGLHERNHFSGWDVDSFAILNGDAVKKTQQNN